MKIRTHKRFDKQYKKLPLHLKLKTKEAIERFSKNPHSPELNNHTLHGRMKRERAFSVTGDIRIIFEEYNSYTLVLFLDIGSHSRVYR